MLTRTQPEQASLNASSASARFFHGLRIVSVGRNPKVTLARIAVLVVTCLVLFNYLLLPIRVTGISMLPAYPDRSVNLVNRQAYLWHRPRRGDVVSIRIAETGEIKVLYLKRIIGLPGETVAFVRGRALINGQPLEEPYVKFACDWNLRPLQLKTDECFVVGDNRSMPAEDHKFGAFRLNRIVGKVVL